VKKAALEDADPLLRRRFVQIARNRRPRLRRADLLARISVASIASRPSEPIVQVLNGSPKFSSSVGAVAPVSREYTA